MEERQDRVIAAALEYEFATRDAILKLNERKPATKVRACLRWADALMQLEALPDGEHRRAGDFLAVRGRIPYSARRIITAEMMRLEAAAARDEWRFARTQTKH